MQKLKSELQVYVNDAADGTASVSPKALEEKVSAAVAEHLSGPQAARYRSEVEKRNAAERDICVVNLVAMLDRDLCLSVRQRKLLSDALTANWEQNWCRMVEMAVVQGQTYVPAITDEVVEPVFDFSQMEVWKKMQKIGNINWNFQPWQVGMFAVPTADPEDDR
jgi:hypothetical protein